MHSTAVVKVHIIDNYFVEPAERFRGRHAVGVRSIGYTFTTVWSVPFSYEYFTGFGKRHIYSIIGNRSITDWTKKTERKQNRAHFFFFFFFFFFWVTCFVLNRCRILCAPICHLPGQPTGAGARYPDGLRHDVTLAGGHT